MEIKNLLFTGFFLFNGQQVFAQKGIRCDEADKVSDFCPSVAKVVGLEDGRLLGGEQVNLLALDFDIKKDWHLYWKNPGDSGQALTLTIKEPKSGVKIKNISWPAPIKFSSSKIIGYGYIDHVLIPFEITTSAATRSKLTLDFEMRYLTCSDRCLMRKRKMSRTFEVVEKGAAANSTELSQVMANLPKKIENLELKPRMQGKDKSELLVDVKCSKDTELYGVKSSDLVFIPSEEGMIDDSASQILNSSGDCPSFLLSRDPVRLTWPKTIAGLLLYKKDDKQKSAEVEIVI